MVSPHHLLPPPSGTRRAGLCSSGVPTAHRHITEGIPRAIPGPTCVDVSPRRLVALEPAATAG